MTGTTTGCNATRLASPASVTNRSYTFARESRNADWRPGYRSTIDREENLSTEHRLPKPGDLIFFQYCRGAYFHAFYSNTSRSYYLTTAPSLLVKPAEPRDPDEKGLYRSLNLKVMHGQDFVSVHGPLDDLRWIETIQRRQQC